VSIQASGQRVDQSRRSSSRSARRKVAAPRTQRAYAFDLLAFARWLDAEGLGLAAVDTDALLWFLMTCREAVLPARPDGNVYSIKDGRNAGYAPSTINRRLAAISALFAFREIRDPTAGNPMPRARPAEFTSHADRSLGAVLESGNDRQVPSRSARLLADPANKPLTNDLEASPKDSGTGL
jgi:integrase